MFTNVKNSKNSEYYEKVIEELKERCQACNEVSEYDAKQTREKFKGCIGICKDAAVKIKTVSQSNLLNWTPRTMVAAVIQRRGVQTRIHQQILENNKKTKTRKLFVSIHETKKKRQRKDKKV